ISWNAGKGYAADIDRPEHRDRLWSIRDNPILYDLGSFSESRRKKHHLMNSIPEGEPRSGEHSPSALGFLHAVDPADQRGGAQIALLGAREREHVAERALHEVDQTRVDLLLAPEELLEPLHPLEVGDRHAAGVGEDVGHDEDAALVEDRVGL